MGIIGDLSKFTQFQVAESMEAAAKNPAGGGAAAGMGMGMGFGMANAMMGQMGSMAPGQPQQQGVMPSAENKRKPPRGEWPTDDGGREEDDGGRRRRKLTRPG